MRYAFCVLCKLFLPSRTNLNQIKWQYLIIMFDFVPNLKTLISPSPHFAHFSQFHTLDIENRTVLWKFFVFTHCRNLQQQKKRRRITRLFSINLTTFNGFWFLGLENRFNYGFISLFVNQWKWNEWREQTFI